MRGAVTAGWPCMSLSARNFGDYAFDGEQRSAVALSYQRFRVVVMESLVVAFSELPRLKCAGT